MMEAAKPFQIELPWWWSRADASEIRSEADRKRRQRGDQLGDGFPKTLEVVNVIDRFDLQKSALLQLTKEIHPFGTA